MISLNNYYFYVFYSLKNINELKLNRVTKFVGRKHV